MIEFYNLYLPKSKREVKIEVSVPRYKGNITFETMYFLDGQNAFNDSRAAFGRSIRATKHLGYTAKELGMRILGVAVYNSGSDLGRINEYTPFKIDNAADNKWLSHNPLNCYNYCDDFINTIIPFIESKYNTYKDANHRYIYGSSLAAVTAIYLGCKYEAFNYIGAFSTASFLFDKEFTDFVNKSNLKGKNIFIYVGKNESSDDLYDNTLYFNSSLKLYNMLKNKKIPTRMVVDINGVHNEETWDKHLFEFITFIYDNDLIYSK